MFSIELLFHQAISCVMIKLCILEVVYYQLLHCVRSILLSVVWMILRPFLEWAYALYLHVEIAGIGRFFMWIMRFKFEFNFQQRYMHPVIDMKCLAI